MRRGWVPVLGILAAGLAAPAPVIAQRGADRDSPAERLARCERREQRNLARLGTVGDAASSVTHRLGRLVGASDEDLEPVLRIGRSLSNAIARRLDCDEQEKAATATEQLVDRDNRRVGATVRWTSETRRGVTGSSTITAIEADAADGDCMTVTDIVIVDGEETRAPKRMCRRPPANRYVRV